MGSAKVSMYEALDAIKAGGRFLEWPNGDASRALALALPYAECEEFADAPPGHTPIARALICAFLGDCYRSLGEVDEAVRWYLQARAHCKEVDVTPFFAGVFARMVVDHQLLKHREIALECLHVRSFLWARTPLLRRLYCHVVSGWWYRPYHWRLWWREWSLLRELEELRRTAGETQSGTGH